MLNSKYILLGFVVCSSTLFGGVKLLKNNDWSVTRKIPKPSSTVSFLLNKGNRQQLLLKQLAGGAKRYVNNLAMDALGAIVAESVGILCNSIDIMPCHYSSMYKSYQKQPATLHSVIAGSTLKGVSWFDDLTIRQRKTDKPYSGLGLHLLAIRSMVKHADLPPIAALDTFLGNDDRHRNNMIYNRQSDRLHAIDFTLAFSKNLASITLKNLKMLQRHKTTFTPAQKAALTVYNETLKKLLAKHSPASLCKMIDTLVKQTGFPGHCHLTNKEHKKITENIAFRKKMVHQNYESTKALVNYLNANLVRDISAKGKEQ